VANKYFLNFHIDTPVQATEFRNFNDVLMHNFVQHRETIALEYTEGERTERFTYRQMSHQVYTVVNYLTTNGFQPDEHVVVWMPNCPDAMWADLGVTLAGGILTPLSPEIAVEDVVYVLQQLQATYIFVATIEQLSALQAYRAKLPKLKSIVVQAATEAEEIGIATFYWMMNFPTQINSLGAVHEVREQRTVADALNILYPTKNETTTKITRKGIVLTHGNILAAARSIGGRLGVEADKKQMRYPLMVSLDAIHERIMGYYTMLYFGKTMVIAEPIQGRSLSAQIAVTTADILCINSEKMEALSAQLTLAMQESTLAQWALTNGLTVADLELNNGTVSWWMRKKHNFYRKQRDRIKTKYAKTLKTIVTYGEPLQTQTVYFYHTLGWNVLQSFGEAETCGFATIDDPTDPRPLTAGKALGSLEVEIERYGPIVVKGNMVAKMYHNDPKATANAFDAQGFFQCTTKGHLDNFRLVVAPKIGANNTVQTAAPPIVIGEKPQELVTEEE
jgi:long-chain acyl-CoA synthetase